MVSHLEVHTPSERTFCWDPCPGHYTKISAWLWLPQWGARRASYQKPCRTHSELPGLDRPSLFWHSGETEALGMRSRGRMATLGFPITKSELLLPAPLPATPRRKRESIIWEELGSLKTTFWHFLFFNSSGSPKLQASSWALHEQCFLAWTKYRRSSFLHFEQTCLNKRVQ